MMIEEQYPLEDLLAVVEIWKCSKKLVFENELVKAAQMLEEAIEKFNMLAVSLRFELAQIYHYQAEGIGSLEKIITILICAIDRAGKMQNFLDLRKPKRFISEQAKRQAVKWDLLLEEISFARRCSDKLTLLYCQMGRNAEASILLSNAGFTHRLADCVLNYKKLGDEAKSYPNYERNEYASFFDNVLDEDAKSRLSSFLSPGSTFWKWHNYNEFESTGYFSYLFSLHSTPSNFIEQLIKSIFDLININDPVKAERIKVAEWWCHCRPHVNGHQMHFDSENEGQGNVRHPILSTVLYVSGEVGGPTFITTQLLEDQSLAKNGWFVYPKENRLAVFDSRYLHGVIPGSGCPADSHSRRITFMIGFWDEIKPITDQPGHGASRLVPSKADWLESIESLHQGPILNESISLNASLPVPVPEVWQSIECTELKDLKLPPYECCFQGF